MVETNNYCVIMAGGVGSRFWPLSRKALPKQFIDFFGTGRTLLQQTYDRFRKILEADRIFVVTNVTYKELVMEQLPELPPEQILAEPTRRNTAPCVAWAAYHIHALNPDANIVVTPSDQLILKEPEFLQTMTEGFSFVSYFNRLLCVGIKPTRPETRYGYIQVGDESSNHFHPVKTFTEKPEQELAEVFVESGEFYWNTGIFFSNVNALLYAFHVYIPDLVLRFEHPEDKQIYGTPDELPFIEKNFPSCPNVSIEYGILEKSDNVYIITCDFGWSDLGTWSTYYDASHKTDEANVVNGSRNLLYDSTGCVVSMSDSKKLLVAHGLQDYLVVDTENVLLICPKDDTATLRKCANEAQVKMGDEYI